MPVVGDIAINVTADIGPLVRELGRGSGVVSGFGGAVAKTAAGLKNFGGQAQALGARMSIVTAAIAGAAGAAFLLTKNAAALGDEVYNSAKAAGVSAEYYQEMRFALSQVADVSDDEFGAAMVRLTKTLGEAQQGSDTAIKAFEAIGISAADIASGSVSTEEAMDAMIAKLDSVKDPALAAAISTDLFGKAGARMGGLLVGAGGEIDSLRSRAQELGIVMSDDAVAASEQFGDSMEEVTKSFEGLKIKIAAVLLPVLVNDLIPTLVDTVIPAIGRVVTKIAELISWFQGLPEPVQTAASVIAVALGAGGPVLVAIGLVSTALGTLVAATGPIGLFIAAAALASTAWALWGDEIKAAVGDAIDWITTKFDAFMAKLQAIIDFAGRVKTAVSDALTVEPIINYDDPNNLDGVMGGPGIISGTGGLTGPTGGDAADGLIDGFTNRMAERRPEIEAAIQMLPDAARELLQIQSPSKVFAEIGGYIGEGLAQGIADSQALVAASVATIGNTATTSTDGMVSSILGSMGVLFGESKKFGAAQALINAWIGASEALKLPFPANLAAFGKVLATGMSAVNAIKGARPGSTGGSVGGGASAAAPVQTPLQVQFSGISADRLYSGADINAQLDMLQKAAGDRGFTILRAIA